MVLPFLLEHVSELKHTKNGTPFVMAYVRSLNDAGEPDWQQNEFPSYSSDAIEMLQNTKDGQQINVNLRINSAFIEDVSLLKATATK